MNKKLTFEAFYPHSPERVWQAITDSATLAEWLLPSNFEPKIGFKFQFEGLGRGEKGKVEGEVLEAKAAKRLRYTWDDGEAGAPSVVTWNLTPADGGTRVTLEHLAEPETKPIVLIEANMNYRYMLRQGLRARLAPIVYCDVEPEKDLPKAGFRWQETVCK